MGIDKDVLSDGTDCFLRLEVTGFVRRRDFELGWREGDKSVLGEEGFGLKRGDSEGEERMVSMVSK